MLRIDSPLNRMIYWRKRLRNGLRKLSPRCALLEGLKEVIVSLLTTMPLALTIGVSPRRPNKEK